MGKINCKTIKHSIIYFKGFSKEYSFVHGNTVTAEWELNYFPSIKCQHTCSSCPQKATFEDFEQDTVKIESSFFQTLEIQQQGAINVFKFNNLPACIMAQGPLLQGSQEPKKEQGCPLRTRMSINCPIPYCSARKKSSCSVWPYP